MIVIWRVPELRTSRAHRALFPYAVAVVTVGNGSDNTTHSIDASSRRGQDDLFHKGEGWELVWENQGTPAC